MSRRIADYLGRYRPGSDAWHELRTNGLGGSEIAAVLGLSPYESAFSLWHRKRGEAGRQGDNAAMRAGRYLEDAVAEMFKDAHPEWRVETTGTWRNRTRAYQVANPDRLIGTGHGREVLEIKTTSDAHGWGEPGTDEIPVYYRAQVLWYLDTLGLARAHVAVLIRGVEYREYVVEWNADEVAILREAGAEFVRTMQTGERPSIDDHGETYDVVKELHPDIQDDEVEIPAELAQRYRDALHEHKTAEDAKRQVAAELADVLGHARRAVCAGESIAIRKPGRNGGAPYLNPSPQKKPAQKVEAAA